MIPYNILINLPFCVYIVRSTSPIRKRENNGLNRRNSRHILRRKAEPHHKNYGRYHWAGDWPHRYGYSRLCGRLRLPFRQEHNGSVCIGAKSLADPARRISHRSCCRSFAKRKAGKTRGMEGVNPRFWVLVGLEIARQRPNLGLFNFSRFFYALAHCRSMVFGVFYHRLLGHNHLLSTNR